MHIWTGRRLQLARSLLIRLADTLKGSYYANPVIDNPDVSPALKTAYPEYYGENICMYINPCLREWPLTCMSSCVGPADTVEEVSGFSEAFKNLGGCEMRCTLCCVKRVLTHEFQLCIPDGISASCGLPAIRSVAALGVGSCVSDPTYIRFHSL